MKIYSFVQNIPTTKNNFPFSTIKRFFKRYRRQKVKTTLYAYITHPIQDVIWMSFQHFYERYERQMDVKQFCLQHNVTIKNNDNYKFYYYHVDE